MNHFEKNNNTLNYLEIEGLVARAKNKDERAIERLLINYKFFIYKQASKIFLSGYDMDDLMQVGNMAVIFAIDKYLPGKGNFTSYVTFSIINNLNYLIRQHARDNDIQSIETPMGGDQTLSDFLKNDYCIEDEYLEKELSKILKVEVDKLDSKLKDIIDFVYLAELGTLKEYAIAKRINYNTVIKRKNLAIARLTENLNL